MRGKGTKKTGWGGGRGWRGEGGRSVPPDGTSIKTLDISHGVATPTCRQIMRPC